MFLCAVVAGHLRSSLHSRAEVPSSA
jgi:hypothetical protein